MQDWEHVPESRPSYQNQLPSNLHVLTASAYPISNTYVPICFMNSLLFSTRMRCPQSRKYLNTSVIVDSQSAKVSPNDLLLSTNKRLPDARKKTLLTIHRILHQHKQWRSESSEYMCVYGFKDKISKCPEIKSLQSTN